MQSGAADLPTPATLEDAIAAVLEGRAENDAFNRLIVDAAMDPQSVVLLRAWFRYLRQGGHDLWNGHRGRRAGAARLLVATALIDRFAAAHDPRSQGSTSDADAAIERGLDAVSAIDDDRILRAYRARCRGDAAHQCLRPRRRRSAGVQARQSSDPRPARPRAVARDLGLFAARRGHSPARRTRRARGACAGPTGVTISASKFSA